MPLPDPLQDVFWRVLGPGREGGLPRQHREEENTQAPHIARSVIALSIILLLKLNTTLRLLCVGGTDLLLEDLWGHVVGSVAGGHQHSVVSPQLLGEPKVANPNGFGVARIIRVENIRGLQVPIMTC